MNKDLNKNIFYFTILVISFIGGSFSFMFWNYLADFSKNIKAADAISIANTYIVFTTIIFVGFSVFLAIAGFIFTHQFSTTKEDQFSHLLRELGTQLKENEDDVGIKFISKSLENPDVKNYLSDKLNKKLDQLIKEKAYNLNKEQTIINGLSSSDHAKDQGG
ncbi:MAG: hypothetical protein HQK75_00235 [Candidatus Magnetomorum sp.]|nr:hypothetical protein [Candidatus Magnetomorum sp.]